MKIINIRQMMANSGVEFGTSGARGLVNAMTDEVCAAYTLAFLQALKLTSPGQKIALGMDLRPSSPDIVRACAKGVRQTGCLVDFCGVLPTPALACYALSLGIPAIMITGSHIPFDRNGIKFYRPEGEIDKRDEIAIGEAVIELASIPVEPTPLAVNPQALQQYVRRYTDLFKSDLLRDRRIGVYEHTSTARDCLKEILIALGAKVIGLDRTETFVPIDTEAVSEEDRRRGQAWAAEYNLDAIVSTDGDGDRPLIADETGNWLRGDIVGLLCARFLGANTVVTPVSCNTAIEASGYFEKVIRTRIGSPYVIAGMELVSAYENSGVAGFEANGGFLAGPGLKVGDQQLAPLPTRDAILPALAILAMARFNQSKVSDLLMGLPSRYTASNRIQNFPTANSKTLINNLQNDDNAYKNLWDDNLGSVIQKDTLDGLRLTFSSGEIVHLRPSGNAPELRCYAEAASIERAEALVSLTLERIANG